MGNCAENTVKNYKITREQQDEYAIQSYRNAQKAWADKAFADEIAPVTVNKSPKGENSLSTPIRDSTRSSSTVSPTLKPAFVRDGNALVLGSRAIAQAASPIALERAGITKDQVAIWEFNEAFASVIPANSKILGLEGAEA
ncbi:Thiolase, C-terminal [Fusarium oxysporum f. sp. vasinfectum]|nr:Thiolase, C-terminal [Fusarium oxysporum f. sp. vasinfectum]